MHQHAEDERWDRQQTREAFARFAARAARTTPERTTGVRASAQRTGRRAPEPGALPRGASSPIAARRSTISIQVGTVGLLKAIDRFDLERGVEFTTYATPTIVGEIKRYFRDKGWAVKVPRRLQELNLAVNRAIEKLAIKLGRSPTVAELAEHLSAAEEEILEAQELGQAYNLLSLDTEVSGEGRQEVADARRLQSAQPTRAWRCSRTGRTSSARSTCSPAASASSSTCAFTRASRRPRSPNASTSRRCTSRACSKRRSRNCARPRQSS